MNIKVLFMRFVKPMKPIKSFPQVRIGMLFYGIFKN